MTEKNEVDENKMTNEKGESKMTNEKNEKGESLEKSEMSFEQSFTRLEEILEKMNSGSASLDESLKLYEEADKLIGSCSKRLVEAEQKIEVLIKNRNGEVELDGSGKAKTQKFDV